jgi:glycosyltransferase involved in cell wall biosynthesis
VHPWFPQYRVPFFELLIDRGRTAGLEIDIFHGPPPPEWAERGDSIRGKPYAVQLPARHVRVGRRHLILKSLRPLKKKNREFDLVVFEHAIRNLETLNYVLTHKRSRIAFWGHGRTYTVESGVLQETLKRLILRRASWYFAYTQGGKAAVEKASFPAERITEVRNSIDTGELVRSISNLSESDRQWFAKRHSLSGRTALYIGGLDSSKRLDFLLEAAERVATNVQGFHLIVAGAGTLSDTIRVWSERHQWLTYLGPIAGQEKALALDAARCIAMPGRVGLVAVDSLATGRPIVTTNWPWHAPEFEYLTSGSTCLTTRDTVEDFAWGMELLMTDDALSRKMSAACKAAAPEYSIENMVENFLSGLMQAVQK